jgi:cytochrome c oxidase subunit 4
MDLSWVWKSEYGKVFVALAVLTVIEIFVAGVPANPTLVAAALVALAVCKAAMVALYYMHLRYDRRLLTYIALSPFVFAAILTLLVLSDSTISSR